jgi:hypothetical protein
MSRACSTNEVKNACRSFVGKSERKRALRRPRRRWMNNVKIDGREIGCVGMDWIGLAEDMNQCRTLVNAVMNLRVL